MKLFFIGLSSSCLHSKIKDELCLQVLAFHEPRGICKLKSPALFFTVQKEYCSDQWENGRLCSWDTGIRIQNMVSESGVCCFGVLSWVCFSFASTSASGTAH